MNTLEPIQTLNTANGLSKRETIKTVSIFIE
jgi:hypothetical protein